MLKLEQLHLALGHLNYPSIILMFHKGLICGISLSQRELSITPPQCNACMKGKVTHASVISIDGTHYMLTLTTDD